MAKDKEVFSADARKIIGLLEDAADHLDVMHLGIIGPGEGGGLKAASAASAAVYALEDALSNLRSLKSDLIAAQDKTP